MTIKIYTAKNGRKYIKLPNGQTREADIYECDKFNGCLLSNFTDNSTPTVEDLNEKCPQSGFTRDDIAQIKNLSRDPTGDCVDKDNTPIVDLFRYYHGLPGTVFDKDTFKDVDDLEAPWHSEQGRPSFMLDFTAWDYEGYAILNWILIALLINRN